MHMMRHDSPFAATLQREYAPSSQAGSTKLRPQALPDGALCCPASPTVALEPAPACMHECKRWSVCVHVCMRGGCMQSHASIHTVEQTARRSETLTPMCETASFDVLSRGTIRLCSTSVSNLYGISGVVSMKLHMLQNGASLADIVISIITNGEVTNRMGVISRGSSVCIRGSPSWTTIRPIACWCACADGKVHQCVCICCRFTGGRGDVCVRGCMYAERALHRYCIPSASRKGSRGGGKPI